MLIFGKAAFIVTFVPSLHSSEYNITRSSGGTSQWREQLESHLLHFKHLFYDLIIATTAKKNCFISELHCNRCHNTVTSKLD